MSAVKVVAKLVDNGVPEPEINAALDGLPIDIQPFDRDAAYAAGGLRRVTKRVGYR